MTPETLNGIVIAIGGFLLREIFLAVKNYFIHRNQTLNDISEAVKEMKGQLKLYGEMVSEIPRLKKGMGILFDRAKLEEPMNKESI